MILLRIYLELPRPLQHIRVDPHIGLKFWKTRKALPARTRSAIVKVLIWWPGIKQWMTKMGQANFQFNKGTFISPSWQRKTMNFWLVVSIPLKNMKVNWDDYFPSTENKKCSKPPNQIWLIDGTSKPLVNIKIDGKWMFIHPNIVPLVLTHGHLSMLNQVAKRRSGLAAKSRKTR